MTSPLTKVCKLNGTLYEWRDEMKEHHGREGYEYGLIIPGGSKRISRNGI